MSAITPTLEDVGEILRARTRSDGTGQETGTFSDTTRPTGTTVTGLIAQAEIDVSIRMPEDINVLSDKLLAFAKRLVELRAAMLIELSLYPDQTVESDSVYEYLKKLYDELWAEFLNALADAGQNVDSAGRLVVAQLVTPYSGDSLVEAV